MKTYFLRKRIFALLFLLGIGAFSAINLYHSVPEILEDRREGKITTVPELENSMDDAMYQKMSFVELFGYTNRLMGKREIKNFTFIRDEAGYMHYASFFREPDDQIFSYALRIKRLQEQAEKKGAKTLFVIPPAKYVMDHAMRRGLPVSDMSMEVEELLQDLNRLGVRTLNLQKELPGSRISYDELFYKTDHHWTIPGAFEGACLVTRELEKMGGKPLDPENRYMTPEAYEKVTYSNVMLGSMGRKSGVNYSGLEDFTCLWPKFEGSYERSWVTFNHGEGHKEGSFQSALMNPQYLVDHDIYSWESLYGIYLRELTLYENIVNRENPEGPSVFMVRDSYFSPVLAFMMPVCSRIEAVWCDDESGEYPVEQLIKDNEYDYVIIEIYPFNIGEKAFQYYKG